jgi:hypothetical protein
LQNTSYTLSSSLFARQRSSCKTDDPPYRQRQNQFFSWSVVWFKRSTTQCMKSERWPLPHQTWTTIGGRYFAAGRPQLPPLVKCPGACVRRKGPFIANSLRFGVRGFWPSRRLRTLPGCLLSGFVFGVSSFGLRVEGVGFGAQGVGFRVSCRLQDQSAGSGCGD